jgi:30S ribosomal protein S31
VQVPGLFVSLSDISLYIPGASSMRAGALKKITMGRGDKKTKKGKIFKGSFGKSRPAKPGKKALPAATTITAAGAVAAVAAVPAKGK